MKVRWMTGSVRLRISPSEMESLQRGEAVTARLDLGAGQGWTATLAPGRPAANLELAGGELTFALSASDLETLARDDTEGVYFRYRLPDGGELRYFVEKDWACAHPRTTEPELETFARPAER